MVPFLQAYFPWFWLLLRLPSCKEFIANKTHKTDGFQSAMFKRTEMWMHLHIQRPNKQEVKAHTYRFQLGEQIIIDTFNSYYLKCVFSRNLHQQKWERNSGAVRWIAVVRVMLHLLSKINYVSMQINYVDM